MNRSAELYKALIRFNPPEIQKLAELVPPKQDL